MQNDINKLFIQYVSMLLAAALMLSCCDNKLTPEQKRQNAVADVGIDASVTASFFVSSARACQVVGISDLEKCAELKGSLLAEQSAQMTAKLYLDQKASYNKKCLKISQLTTAINSFLALFILSTGDQDRQSS